MRNQFLSAAVVAGLTSGAALADVGSLAECYYERVLAACPVFCEVDFSTLPSKYVIDMYGTHALGRTTLSRVEFDRETGKVTVVKGARHANRELKKCLGQ